MLLAHDMRERALVLLQISNESVEFKEHAAYVAVLWLTLAALEDRFRHPGHQAGKESATSAAADRLS
jgi:hypothetical protein